MADTTEVRAKRLSEIDDEAEQTGGSKGKKPAAKKPAASKSASGKQASKNAKPAKKGHPVFKVFLFTMLFWIILIGAFIALFRLYTTDEYGEVTFLIDREGIIRGPIMEFLNPDQLDREQYYEIQLSDLNARDAELAVKEADFETREEALDERESALSEKEDVINDYVEKINAQGSGNNVDIVTVARSIEKMASKKAASVLTAMTTDNAVAILKVMSETKRGQALEQMEDDTAASLIEAMLPDPDDVPDLSDYDGLTGD